jgi:hypothetical protein
MRMNPEGLDVSRERAEEVGKGGRSDAELDLTVAIV